MANTSTAPSRTLLVERTVRPQMSVPLSINGTDTYMASKLAQTFLASSDVVRLELVGIVSFEHNYGLIAFGRVFDVLSEECFRLGAVMYVRDALLGYGGNGPGLTKQILSFLGVSEEIFEEIQNSTAGQTHGPNTYRVVVSREGHNDWTWWRAD